MCAKYAGSTMSPSRRCFRWRRKFGGMELSEAKRLRELERENSQLKNMVAELSLDNRMLRDVVAKKW
jgi:putative transposase